MLAVCLRKLISFTVIKAAVVPMDVDYACSGASALCAATFHADARHKQVAHGWRVHMVECLRDCGRCDVM